jgi:hypothetical protein
MGLLHKECEELDKSKLKANSASTMLWLSGSLRHDSKRQAVT